MKKYWLTFTNALSAKLTYRVNLMWQILSHLFSMLIIYLLWSTILKTGFGSSQYSQASLASYYLAITFIGLFIDYDYRIMAEDIRLGTLSTHLVRPYNYFFEVFVEGLADKLIILLIFIPVFIKIIDFKALGLIIISLFLAMLMRFFLALTIGGIAFRFNRVHGFNAAFFTIASLFSGELIPSNLLPGWLQTIGNFLPFKYFLYTQAKYFSGNFAGENIVFNLFMQVLWLFIWFLIVKLIWTSGLRYYESAGR